MPGGISVHVIDVTRAVPAAGMRVSISVLGDASTVIAEGALSDRGVLDHPITEGEGIDAGIYEIVFDVGPYYRAAGCDLPRPAFLEEVPFRLGISDPRVHYHLPMKMSPWGYSLFRGG